MSDRADLDRYDPETWQWEGRILAQPGQRQIQTDLFYDYQTNVEAIRAGRPGCATTIRPCSWSGADMIPRSHIPEPEAYRRDVPDAEVHILDAGHFALDTAADEIAALIRDFVGCAR